MMKKRIFAAFAAMAVLAASTATGLAEYDPNKVIGEADVATKMTVIDYNLNMNGVDVDSPEPFENEDGVMMLPLRAMTEEMGFDVEWQGETGTIILSRGPIYITMSAVEDGYTFSKTAPMKLGTAPVLIDGVTYVPDNFLTEIVGAKLRYEDNGLIRIVYGEQVDVALIDSVNAEEKQLNINDILIGEVVLSIGEETPIVDEEGNAVPFEELEEGITIKVNYGEMMTRSLPPMNIPNSIMVLSGSPAMPLPSAEEVAAADVAIVELVDNEEGTVSVNDLVRGEVVLVISEETAITGLDGEAMEMAELKSGMTVEIVYGDAMTMSLPPINNPVSITVISETPIVQIEPVDKIEAFPGPDVEITPVEPEEPQEK